MLPRLTGGAWVFVTFLVWIGAILIWLKFIDEPLHGKYMWVGAIIATVLAFLTFKYGPRPYGPGAKEEEEEEEE